MKDLIDHAIGTLNAQNQVLAEQSRGYFNEIRPMTESEPDGPIREPGDDAPKWSDVYTTEELSAAVHLHAAKLAKRGDYGASTDLSYAADAIDEQAVQLDEARATVQRLLDKIAELEIELLGYRPKMLHPGNEHEPADYKMVRADDEDEGDLFEERE